MSDLRFLEGNDRIANLLLAPLLLGLMLGAVGVCVNVWRDGPLAVFGLIGLPLIPIFAMPAQTILFLIGRDQEIRTKPRIFLAVLSFTLLCALALWGWANHDAMAETSTGGLALTFVAFAHAGVAAVAGGLAKKFGRCGDRY